jgi:hypothetical protein
MLLDTLQENGFMPEDNDEYVRFVGSYLVRVIARDNGEVRIYVNEENNVGIWSQTLLNAPDDVIEASIKLAIANAQGEITEAQLKAASDTARQFGYPISRDVLKAIIIAARNEES